MPEIVWVRVPVSDVEPVCEEERLLVPVRVVDRLEVVLG